MASKTCDHTSVGMLVWDDDNLLLIERKKFPFGFAPPAGHIDDDPSYEASAKRELKEEVGLNTNGLELVLEGRRENSCRRDDGGWHYWKIYRTEASGDLKRSESETKQARWFSRDEIQELAKRTEAYQNKKITDEEWQQLPGIEEVWYGFFRELGIIT